MTVYERKDGRERVRPVPGGAEETRIKASGNYVVAKVTRIGEKPPAADAEREVRTAHGTAKIKLGGGSK